MGKLFKKISLGDLFSVKSLVSPAPPMQLSVALQAKVGATGPEVPHEVLFRSSQLQPIRETEAVGLEQARLSWPELMGMLT